MNIQVINSKIFKDLLPGLGEVLKGNTADHCSPNGATVKFRKMTPGEPLDLNKKFAIEATKGATSIDQLVKAFGISGTGSASSLRFAEALGIGGAARAAAQGGCGQAQRRGLQGRQGRHKDDHRAG